MTDRPVHVLVSFNQPRRDALHFVQLFGESLEGRGVRLSHFSPAAVIFRRIDVFNLHWPELLVTGSTRPRQAVKNVLVTILLVRLLVQRIPVVYVVHNLAPHEPLTSMTRRFLYRRVLAQVTIRSYLNESTENDYRDGVVILHGRYQVESTELKGAATDGILHFGNLRPYKGIERLIDAYSSASSSIPRLDIMGNPSSDEYGQQIADLAAAHAGIQVCLRYISESELLDALRRSRIVVLPYRQMYNSGAVLLALSAGRPVVIPDSGANRALRSEVGEGWVYLFDPDAHADELAALIALAYATANTLTGAPDLRRRQWNDLGALYDDLFRTVRRGAGRENRASLEKGERFRAHSQCNQEREQDGCPSILGAR